MPAPTASSMISWSAGTSMIGRSSLGTALVAGRNRVPRPAAGMTAVRTRMGRAYKPADTLGTHQRRVLMPPERFMPTYVYKFIDTGETIEVQQAFTDDALTEAVHPASGDTLPVKKVFLPVGVTFKGGGFYKTDSRNGSKSSSSASKDSASSSSSDSGSGSGSGSSSSGSSSDGGSSSSSGNGSSTSSNSSDSGSKSSATSSTSSSTPAKTSSAPASS